MLFVFRFASEHSIFLHMWRPRIERVQRRAQLHHSPSAEPYCLPRPHCSGRRLRAYIQLHLHYWPCHSEWPYHVGHDWGLELCKSVLDNRWKCLLLLLRLSHCSYPRNLPTSLGQLGQVSNPLPASPSAANLVVTGHMSFKWKWTIFGLPLNLGVPIFS